MTKLVCATVLAISACQIIDDATYKPKLGALLPDAAPPEVKQAVCPDTAPGDTCGDSNPRVDVSFARQIRPLLSDPGSRCATHMMMQTDPTIRLDMTTYQGLITGGVHQIIVPCRPCDSILVHKIEDTVPPSGGVRMPMTGNYFGFPDLLLIRDWIAEGALDD